MFGSDILNFLILFRISKDCRSTGRYELYAHEHAHMYEGVSKSFRTGRLEQELQIVQLYH
jgi:hypothetical protein